MYTLYIPCPIGPGPGPVGLHHAARDRPGAPKCLVVCAWLAVHL